MRPLFGNPAVLDVRIRGFASLGYPRFAIYRRGMWWNVILNKAKTQWTN